MKKDIIIAAILITGLFAGVNLRAQQHLSVPLNDTLHITIDQARGQLQWEVSYDSIIWQPIPGQTGMQLTTIADSLPAWYRLEIIEDECDPWFSEVLYVTRVIPFVCGAPVSHGYVFGITPDTSQAFAARTYSTVQAAWTGAGGNKCWLKMNLGAVTEPATATDISLDARGWFFQFNRKQAYWNNGTTRIPNTLWINPINENSNWDLFNDPCRILLGSDWRVPTAAEWSAYLNASQAQGGLNNGVLNDAYASTLKLHAAGNLSGSDGSMQNAGTFAYLWSSNENSNNTAGSFRSGAAGSFPVNSSKVIAYSLRCICDCP
jgi:hypothetical protein